MIFNLRKIVEDESVSKIVIDKNGARLYHVDGKSYFDLGIISHMSAIDLVEIDNPDSLQDLELKKEE